MLVKVSNKYRNTYRYRKKLNAFGMQFISGKWKINTNDKSLVNKIIRYCKRKKLHCECIEDKYVRNASYRKDFVSHYKKHNDEYFRCAYCGKKITSQKMTVDHIIPIDKVQHYWKYRLLMILSGMNNVNDICNLTPACERCNKRKGKKISLRYYLKGKIGKSYSGATVFFYTKRIIFLMLIIISVIVSMWYFRYDIINYIS